VEDEQLGDEGDRRELRLSGTGDHARHRELPAADTDAQLAERIGVCRYFTYVVTKLVKAAPPPFAMLLGVRRRVDRRNACKTKDSTEITRRL
jgi:hypothetical protein